MSIGKRLREERERLGYTQPDFSELAGTTKRTQINYEQDERQPNTNYLTAVAQRGADVLYILTGLKAEANKQLATLDHAITIAGQTSESFEDIKSLASSINTQMQDAGFVLVPRHDVAASAGNGAIIHDESIVDHLAFKREWLTQVMGCAPDRVCVIQVRGDSMTPTINDADLLLLDMRADAQRYEGVYVIQLQGSLLVKRLRFKVNGTVDVISDNPRYATETLTNKESNQLTVLGRVVWHGCKF